MNSEIRIEDLAITYGRAMGRPEAEDAIIEALKELAALRDTQERELRELLSHYHFDTSDIPSVVKAIIEGNIKTTAELARRDEQLQQMIEGKTHDDAQHAKVIAEISERQVEELRSLRRELARRDEVEKELRERIGELTERVLKWQKFGTSKSIDLRETRISLSHLLSAEASLRSRIGELETKLGERT